MGRIQHLIEIGCCHTVVGLKVGTAHVNQDGYLVVSVSEQLRELLTRTAGYLRADIADPKQNEKIEAFEYEGMKICNFEMESSAVAGLASLLGHRAMTCCMVIANRYTTEMNTEYKNSIDTLIQLVLDRI